MKCQNEGRLPSEAAELQSRRICRSAPAMGAAVVRTHHAERIAHAAVTPGLLSAQDDQRRVCARLCVCLLLSRLPSPRVDAHTDADQHVMRAADSTP